MWKCVPFLVTISLCSAYKILVIFPWPGGSHAILGEGYARHLLNAGHEVTYIAGLPHKITSPNFRQIDISDSLQKFQINDTLSIQGLMKKELNMQDTAFVIGMMNDVAETTLSHPDVVSIMENPDEKFDVVVSEWLYSELYSGFASIFECPLIWASSMDPHMLVLRLIDEVPNPAYVADHMSSENPPFTFMQRVKELWSTLEKVYVTWTLESKGEIIYKESFKSVAAKRGVALTPYNEMKYKASLILGNSHVVFGQAMRLPQNYKPILGYHISEKINPLPDNLQKIMDNSPEGVIYFSMGSMLKSSTLPEKMKQELVKMFGKFRHTVLWKFEEELPNLPSNLHIVKWAPQQSILNHPNCLFFITHGGLLSLTETIHFGVPVIGVPMFADQFLNVDRAVLKGFALKVDLDWDFADNLEVAVKAMLSDERYRRTARALSQVYHDRPVAPGAELAHWVRHVVATGGAPHLRSPALLVPFYQKLFLDVLAAAILTLVILAFCIKLAVHKITKQKTKTVSKEKDN